MSCCGEKLSDPIGTIRTRAGLCHSCPKGRHGPSGGVILCTVSGLEIEKHLRGEAACPRGRYPDVHGIVRWFGVRWIGVPAPIRWYLRLGGLRVKFDGCGCIEWVKRHFHGSRSSAQR